MERCIDDEPPFEIPENWCWVRFGTALVNRDAERIPLSVSQREKLDKKYDYYGASGVIDKVDRYLFDKPLLLVGEDGANLLLRSKPIAFIASGQYWVNNHAHVIDAVAGVDLRYTVVLRAVLPNGKKVRGYRVFREVCAPQVSFEFFYHSERPPFTMILYRVPFTAL